MQEKHIVTQLLPWVPPLDFAARVDAEHWVLLYSGASATYSGQYSYLAVGVEDAITTDNFTAIGQAIHASEHQSHYQQWFGYFGYPLRHDVEQLPHARELDWVHFPPAWLARFETVYRFDHQQQRIERRGPGQPCEAAPPAVQAPLAWAVKNIYSTMSREEYCRKVETILAAVSAGDVYQANLTRKFYGTFREPSESFQLFRTLCSASPAPYSAYLKMGEKAVLSSSPERFITTEPYGLMTTRPIKGSIGREADAERDAQAKITLRESVKDKAENLMIVDLMRNDFSRICQAGSVRTKKLFEVTTHANVHHMSSTITGVKKPEISVVDALRQCFPPGSMTGAPKIRAMELCSALEEYERGVYSGVLGWLDNAGSADMSVIIRTVLVEGDRFEFQVGGGIVADSTPEKEWQETMVKARGIAAALDIPMHILEML